MKTLKSLALIAGLATITFGAVAQEKNNMTPAQMAQKQTEKIKQNVTGITSDQESKILAVETDFAQGAQDARSSSNGDREAMKSKMQPLRATRDAKMKEILTADQYTQFQTMEAAHKREGKGGK
jgi:hypothetical protein